MIWICKILFLTFASVLKYTEPFNTASLESQNFAYASKHKPNKDPDRVKPAGVLSFWIYAMVLNIPIKIINECRDKGEIRLLADFIFMKTLFSNSCFFNATNSNLSRKTGFSRTKVSRVKEFAARHGWTREHSGNLVLAFNKEKLQAVHKIQFITQPDILNQIEYYLVHNKQAQCERIYKLRKDLKNPTNLADHKKALNHKKYSSVVYGGEICEHFVLSTPGAAKVFNYSATKANQTLLKLERAGLLIIQRVRKFYKRCSREMFRYFIPPKNAIGSFWYFKGRIYNSLPNIIRLAPQPLLVGLSCSQIKTISKK